MIKNLIKKFNLKAKNSLAVDPIAQETAENSKLKILSKLALNLYEKKSNVKKFAKLAISDPENNSENEIVEELANKGIIPKSILTDDYNELVKNENFLRDLEID